MVVNQGGESAEVCAILQKRYETSDGQNDWAKMWGSVRCCHCLKEKEGWTQLYFESKGCRQCNERHPKPEEEPAQPEA